MQIIVEKLSPVLLELQIEVPAEQVRSEVEKAYASIQRTARVKGFRPGKAPRQVLAHLYWGRVSSDVTKRLVDTTLNVAMADKRVEPLSEPAIVPSELTPAGAFSYKARFEIRPEIVDIKWEGLPARRPSAVPTEAAIDAEIARLRREHSTLQVPDPERSVKHGDVVTMMVVLQGNQKEPQEVDVELGVDQNFKEIDDALIGMSPGDAKDVEVTFSEDHPNPEMRGHKGTFHIAVKEVKERISPDVDDELAKDCGSDTLAALREAVKERLGAELKEHADNMVAEQLIVGLAQANPIPVPPSMTEMQARESEREMIAAARRHNQRPDLGQEMRARIRVEAEGKVRAALLMGEIARLKSVQVTDDDVEQGFRDLATQTGKNVAKVKAEHRDPKKRSELVMYILQDKVLDLLEGAANITEIAPS